MARKLKTYQTSLGFFDQAIAAPSMKAALEAWGADSNLFHQGAARESDDPVVVAATMAQPGVVLKRPVGSTGPFREHAELPVSPKLPIFRSLETGVIRINPRKSQGFRAKNDHNLRSRDCLAGAVGIEPPNGEIHPDSDFLIDTASRARPTPLATSRHRSARRSARRPCP